MKIKPNDFLKAHMLDKNIFITGMFYSGITIYNQQIRTLNLIYFLIDEKKIASPNKVKNPIVILGGGVAGITAAMALKKKGYKVTLLEEKSLLLHLQHGCSTRQIHPNLYLWPRENSFKRSTELPFGNWIAADASGVEKQLISEFYRIKDDGGEGELNVVCEAINSEVQLSRSIVSYDIDKGSSKNHIKYSYIILATGFGLEQYVGRKEKTKSYWRNEDLAQLRFSTQIKRFFISGNGDGGISDICRLALIGFDPIDWAKKISEVKNGKLIEDLKVIEKKRRLAAKVNYKAAFEDIFNKHKNVLTKLINDNKRHDIDEIVLNGKENFKDIFQKQKMSFLNAWLVFLIFKVHGKNKENPFVVYQDGEFPCRSGKYIFPTEESEDYYVVIRHGTDRNWDKFKKLNERFEGLSKPLFVKQRSKKYNDFSTIAKWPLKFWQQRLGDTYNALTLPVPIEMTNFFSGYLYTLEGVIKNYIRKSFSRNVNYRATIHRLISFSGEFFFQQVCSYIGTRKGLPSDIGRGFPIDEGIVGMAMRTNTSYSLIKQTTDGVELLEYKKVFARPLSPNIKSFLVVPIPFKKMNSAAICIYVDTYEERLVEQQEFRDLIYSTLLSFVKEMDSKNSNEAIIDTTVIPLNQRQTEVENLQNLPGVNIYNKELKEYWKNNELLTTDGKLIDIYEKI